VRTNCPGILTWQVDGGELQTSYLAAAGGVMAGISHYFLTFDPFAPDARTVWFTFRCTHPNCDGSKVCCQQEEHAVQIV
jgi:hypothetical protein